MTLFALVVPVSTNRLENLEYLNNLQRSNEIAFLRYQSLQQQREIFLLQLVLFGALLLIAALIAALFLVRGKIGSAVDKKAPSWSLHSGIWSLVGAVPGAFMLWMVAGPLLQSQELTASTTFQLVFVAVAVFWLGILLGGMLGYLSLIAKKLLASDAPVNSPPTPV